MLDFVLFSIASVFNVGTSVGILKILRYCKGTKKHKLFYLSCLVACPIKVGFSPIFSTAFSGRSHETWFSDKSPASGVANGDKYTDAYGCLI